MSVALIVGLLCAWLLASIFCVALCISAARGDRGQAVKPVARVRGRRFAGAFEPTI